ncbi:isocitrate dehydrogenase [NAD] subunit gamma, mitochondrial [Hyalella azteca]|uniref:Isocitrate dehydrogenase [NAD] subunit gamma, mitochondrial n=1 Tax=Hyalella azteca TaxID=294128 RepID=A0A8B7N377_HYAAZ|nr:isocitrate dehydrogenase [NAD] subunit gamma, mitochondrial [Hyalella azteca]
MGTEASPKWEFPYALYGGRHTVSLLSMDGIGPEMTSYVQEVFEAAKVPIEFEEVALNKNFNSDVDFERALLSIRRNGIALKGSLESEYASPFYSKSRNAVMRVELDLFVNLFHCKTYPGVPAKHDLDIVVIRQNTEGEYAMIEHETVPGVVECIKVITKEASEKLGRFAFEFAVNNNRKKVTCVHKANIQKQTDGLFMDTMKSLSKDYPSIAYHDMIVDNTCMQLVSNPGQFDVMVTPNLYGLCVQNVVSGLAGGPGLYSGKNFGDKYAVFEPGTRNTGTQLRPNVGNPIAMLNASIDMLRHLRLHSYAQVIDDAIRRTLCVDKIHTQDLGGTASSMDVVQNIILNIRRSS